MEIRHLRFFCALAAELHFTRAAFLLNISQSALSHQIKQLEDELGAQLIQRTNRRVRLTPAGEPFCSTPHGCRNRWIKPSARRPELDRANWVLWESAS
ncbi:MAG: LysR family transcriptional regulator [Acidobacteriota bacterium]